MAWVGKPVGCRPIPDPGKEEQGRPDHGLADSVKSFEEKVACSGNPALGRNGQALIPTMMSGAGDCPEEWGLCLTARPEAAGARIGGRQ